MADKLFPWTEIVPEIEAKDDYIWSCVETEITELPDIISWCFPGQFISLAHIISSTVSNIRSERNFNSTANIVSMLVSYPKREFESTADIVTDISSDVYMINYFVSTADIVFDMSALIVTDMNFSATAALVSDIVSDGNQERVLSVQANIVSDIGDVAINTSREFVSTVGIVSDISDPVFDVHFWVASQANIVSDIGDVAINTSREFVLTVGIVSTITDPVFYSEREMTAQGDIVTDISSDAYLSNYFVSTANIVSIMYSVMPDSRRYLSQANIVTDISAQILQVIDFVSQGNIVTDISSDVNVERELAAQADIVGDISSDGNAERELAAQIDTVIDISSDAYLNNLITSQADIVTDIASDIELPVPDITVNYLGVEEVDSGSGFNGSFNPGAEDASRVIVLVMHWDDTNQRSISNGPYFDGNQMTQQILLNHDEGGWWYRVGIWTLAYPTGTNIKPLNGAIDGFVDRIMLNVYSMYNSDGITPHDTAFQGLTDTGADLDLSVDVEAGGIIFGGAACIDVPSNNGAVFQNLTENYEWEDSNLQMHSANALFAAGATPQSITYQNFESIMDQIYGVTASFSKG